MNFPSPTAAAALLSLALIASVPARADTAPAQGVLGLSASASVEVTKDLLSVTFSTSKEGADANAVQAQLKQALDAALADESCPPEKRTSARVVIVSPVCNTPRPAQRSLH